MKISKELQTYLDKEELTGNETSEAQRLLPSFKRSSEIYAELKKDIEENFVGTLAQINSELEKAKQQSDEIMRQNRDEYYKLSNQIEEKFKKYLFNQNFNFSKKQNQLIFNKALEKGHSDGYYNVEWHFNDLADFVEEINKTE